MGKYNDHRKLEGKHAYLGCSQSSWENRDDEHLISMYYSRYAADIGTAVHKFAQDCIVNKIKLNKNDKHMLDYYLQVIWPALSGTIIPKGAYDSKLLIETVALFVNDAIGFRLDSEVILAYDELYSFGTSDAFGVDEKNKIIRVHDLKTGLHPVLKMDQLLLYAAQYCLEYKKNPKDYSFELRIYQGAQILEAYPPSEEVEKHMKHIVYATNLLRNNVERI